MSIRRKFVKNFVNLAYTCQVEIPRTINGVETLAIAFTYDGKQYIIVNIYAPGDALETDDDWASTL